MMQITMNGLEPVFIEKDQLTDSEIWLRDITIPKGQHLHIVAPSGSGKTSLIHFIYGLNSNYRGRIFYDTKEIREFSAEEFSTYRQRKISIVFQDLKF